jgi:hypothetical protein
LRATQYYFSTILDAGRAYSLFRKGDPQYVELAYLTVTVATGLNYDPLNDPNAAAWYVREAADYVGTHGDPAQQKAAKELLARLDLAESGTRASAQVADEDATAVVKAYPHDSDALLQQVDADVRAYALTKDPKYRSLALERAAQPAFPLANLSDITAGELFNDARSAAAGVPGYSAADTRNGRELLRRRASIPSLEVIGRVKALSHDARMTVTAPADEYFGNLKMSPLGINNELKRINAYLDAGWGTRMTGAGVQLAGAIDELHRVYPRDYELPQFLLRAYQILSRIGSPEAAQSARRMRQILTIEYADSGQARQLLSS